MCTMEEEEEEEEEEVKRARAPVPFVFPFRSVPDVHVQGKAKTSDWRSSIHANR